MLTQALTHVTQTGDRQGKKSAQHQPVLQTEITNDKEWEAFLQKDGLLVVDVYSEWCGPCIGMVGNLKKIKVEIGGDNLHLAIAKSDTIECLKRFRNRSEPTWMFIASGQLITVIFGADAPRITRTIVQELKNEELVKKGELVREKRAPHELTPQEQEIADAQAKILEEKKLKEKAAAEAARLARREARAKAIESHFADVCPALMSPHAQKSLRKVSEALEAHGLLIADKCPVVLTKENMRVLAAEDPQYGSEAVAAAMADRPSLALLFKKLADKEGDIIELSRRALCGDGAEGGEPLKKTVCDELRLDTVPGLFVPADRHQRAATMDLLFAKMVSTLIEPPDPPEPPHVALVFGAWQRRAVLAAAAKVPKRVLRYGFFADMNIDQPRLLCKTVEEYENLPEKDYFETIILMVSVGLAEPELADPSELIPDGPPEELMVLGPVHVSADSVVGAEECARLFPPGYSKVEKKVKPKTKKKKKKRKDRDETVEDNTEVAHVETDANEEAPQEAEGDAEGEGEGEGEAEGEGEEEGEEGEAKEGEAPHAASVDKATSPPPATPH